VKTELETLHSVYAQALFLYADENSLLDRIFFDYEKIISSLKKQADFLKVINHPGISQADKEKVLRDIGKAAGFCPEFIYFLKMLLNKKRFEILHGIFLKFRDIYDAYKDRLKVFMHSPERLDKNVLDKITKELAGIFKKEIMPQEILDKTLIGGIKIRVRGKVYDGSIKKELEHLKIALTS